MRILHTCYLSFTGFACCIKICHYLLLNGSYSCSFFALLNDLYFKILLCNFIVAIFILMWPMLKSIFFGDFQFPEISIFIEKEGLRLIGILVFFIFAYNSGNSAPFFILICYTLISVIIFSIVCKRTAFLLFAPQPQREELIKLVISYCFMITLEWTCILMLKSRFDKGQTGLHKVLYDLLLFEHIMLIMRFILSFLKFTLSLWCIISNSDFRQRFSWLQFVKYFCIILTFAVFIYFNAYFLDLYCCYESISFFQCTFIWYFALLYNVINKILEKI